MKELHISKRGDGAHWGLTDWYPEVERAIKEALSGTEDFDTGWWVFAKDCLNDIVSP